MRFKPLKQEDESACGPASMMMAFADLGIPFKKSEVARITNYKAEEGLSNTQLITALRKFGTAVQAHSNASWKELYACNNPDTVGIVAWMLKGYIWHFSVVEKVTEKSITIADPFDGKHHTYPRIAFLRLWWTCEDMWYPEKNTDIELRWLCLVKKKKTLVS